MTFTGKLTRIELINPHSWLYFEVTEAGRQGVEAPLRDALGAHAAPLGLGEGSLSDRAEQITVEAAPDREDPGSCYLNTIRFANGSRGWIATVST